MRIAMPGWSRHFILYLFSTFLAVHSMLAQPPPVIWGDISPGDFAANGTYRDSSNSAVILCDYGTIGYEDLRGALRIVLFRHVRIKILSTGGQAYANIRIPYRSGGKETIFDVRAVSYSLTQNGDIRTVELLKSSLIDEKINNDLASLVFSVPAVDENSIFEYTYKIASQDLYNFRSWQFQKNLPVLWSEFRAELSGLYNYMAILHNIEQPLYLNEKKDTTIQISPFVLGIQSKSNQEPIRVTNGRWVMRNVPPIKTEPFVNALADHVMELRFQLYSVTIPGSKPVAIVQKWDDIGRVLGNDEHLGGQLVQNRVYKQDLRKLGIDDRTNETNARKIYEWMVHSFSWNGRDGIRSESDLLSIAGKGSGNSAELNLYLINLYREAGYKAYPVLISTLNNGKIQRDVPLISQFSRTICLVEVNGKKLLMDASNPLIPFGLLPFEDINGYGLILFDKTVDWIMIPNKKISRRMTTLTFRFKEDGALSGFLVIRESGYKALEDIRAISESGSDAFAHEILNHISFGLDLDSFKIFDIPGESDTLSFKLCFSSMEWLHQFENMELIYFDAFMPGDFRDNPFRSSYRVLPVEFAYPLDLVQNVVIEIPEGYSVDEVPSPESLSACNGKLEYRFGVTHNEEVVQLQTKLSIRDKIFQPQDYQELKSLFAVMAAKYSEHIVASKDED